MLKKVGGWGLMFYLCSQKKAIFNNFKQKIPQAGIAAGLRGVRGIISPCNWLHPVQSV